MKKLLRLVAWSEVLTGMFMIAAMAINLLSSSDHMVANLKNGSLIALGTLGLFGGIGLLRSNVLAWRGSFVLQLLLMPVFWIGTLLYRPGLGLFIPLGFNLQEPKGASAVNEFSLGVDFMISLGTSGGQQYVAVNVAALASLIVLLLNRPSHGRGQSGSA